MDAFEAVVLGIVQGLTEFLPISSTAHLRIVPAFAGWEDPGTAFTAVVQLGTMLAVVLFFRGDLLRIGRAWFASIRAPERRSDLDARLGWFIVLGTIPIGIFGLAFKDQIESGGRDLYLISIALIVAGLVLLAAERAGARRRPIESLTRRDAAVIGTAQAFALVPGVSRSGATISAGLFLGLDRESAARYSFLLSVPAVVLSGLFELKDALTGDQPTGAGNLVLATALAFMFGYASIAFLLRFLVTHSTRVFVAYRVVLGAVVLALVATSVID
jgi:undecaprenyl-diphosphatase